MSSQLESSRDALSAIHTFGDLEVAEASLFANLGQVEGLLRTDPDSPDALLLLTRAWTEAGLYFIEEQGEQAEDAGDRDLQEVHRTRARAAYTRALHFGITLLEQKADGFERARKSPKTLKIWLDSFDENDMDSLFWTGYAWLARVEGSADIPFIVEQANVGIAMIERVIELDNTFHHGLAHGVLGAHHARSPMGDLYKARSHFEKAQQINHGKLLTTKFHHAKTFHCVNKDKENYEKLMHEVLAAGDPLPSERLSNEASKRRALRYLTKERMQRCGF